MQELLLRRILSGYTEIICGNKYYIYDRPTRESILKSEHIYQAVLDEANFMEMFSDDDILDMLVHYKLWSSEEAEELATLNKNIEELKVKIFQYSFRTLERNKARELLNISRNRQRELLHKRHCYDHVTAQGVAQIAKTHYLICSNLKDEHRQPIWRGEAFLSAAFPELSEILDSLNNSRITETDFRRLARTDPWRGLWNMGKREGNILGISPIDYTDNERFLVSWSIVYDNVYESSECPSDSIIDDDDMLDGWFIVQRRQRESALTKKAGEDLISNDKIKNAGEIFIPADTKEDAEKLDLLNTEQAKIVKKQRMAYLQKHGEVKEQDMPDTRRELMMKLNRAYTESVKGNK